jgi:DNA polymerase-3 subunit gamma/tau
MENEYKVLARKYRPQTFSEIIGQDVLVQTLTNAIEKNKMHHAFILTGIRGVGKTSTARIIAKSLNCVGEDGKGKETNNPCLRCSHCQSIANGNDQDVIEFDAASNTSVEKIRDIIESINYAPINSRYKIYIIDEVHMLSNSAFNALLKTLEEPPAYVKFIFATTEIRKVPITILSRCIRFDLERVPQDLLSEHLMKIAEKEGYKLDKISANLIANAGEGSVRDSLSTFDRIISFNNFSNDISEELVINVLGLGGKEKIYELYESLMVKNVAEVLKKFEKIYYSVVNINGFLNDILEVTHLLLMTKNDIELNGISSFQKNWLKNNKDALTQSALFRIWQFIVKSLDEIKNVNNSKNFLEVLLLKICYGINIPEISDLVKKMKGSNNTNAISDKQQNVAIAKEKNSKELADFVLNAFDGAKMV